MEQFCIYLWAISEHIAFCLIALGLVALVLSPFLFLILGDDMKYKEITPIFVKTVTGGLVLVFLGTLIPSKQDLALMFMFPYIKQGTESVIKSETMNKMKQMTNLYLDEQIKNMKEKKKGGDR